MTLTELFEKWKSISPYTGGFLLISGEHELLFHIGYAGDAQKCFMVMDIDAAYDLPSSKAIEASNVLLENGKFALRFILNYPSLDEIFVKLCWDLMNSSYDAPFPVCRMIAQYKSWMKLLQQASNNVLSVSRQKGLIGELLFLQAKISEVGDSKAFDAWVGPEGSDQDFIFDDSWAEVKTVTISADSVTISSLQQLDRYDDGRLIVYYMDKTSSNGIGTISLPEAVVNTSDMLLSMRLKDRLLCKLAKIGYFEKDNISYNGTRFRLAGNKSFLITPEFPRLIKSCVPREIINATYQLSLPMIDSFKE